MVRQNTGVFAVLTSLSRLAAVQACYYQALNLENPSDYYYRYCYAGCTAIQAGQGDYAACCTPMPAGATAPATCTQLSKSHEEAGTTCQWGAVATTDFPQTYNYAPPPSSHQPAQPTVPNQGGKETVWVTSTTTTACAPGPTTQLPPPPPDSSPVVPPPPPPSSHPEVSVVPESSKYEHHGETTSSGKLAQPTSSEYVAPESSSVYIAPVPSSSPCETTSTYVHQEPSPAPPPPIVSSKAAEATSSPPPYSINFVPPCITSQPGLVYNTYAPPCAGTDCPHVGDAAPSGYVGGDNQKRNTGQQPSFCPHVGAAPSDDFVPENAKRAPEATITPAPLPFLHDREIRDPVIGYEPPAKRQGMADIERVKRPPPYKRELQNQEKRGLTETVISTVTGSQTFYECGGTWIQGTSGAAAPTLSHDSAGAGSSVTGGSSSAGGMAYSLKSALSGVGAGPSVDPRKRELPVTITQVQTLFPTASCPYPNGQIPGASPTATYIPGPHPSGAKCFCAPDSEHPNVSLVSPGVSSPSYHPGGMSLNFSGGVGNIAPSDVVLGLDMDRRANGKHDSRADGQWKRGGTLVECDCDCGKVVSVAPPEGTSVYSGSSTNSPGGLTLTHSGGVGDAPSGSVDLDNARRAQPTTTPGVSERNAPRGYLPVIGGFIKRDVPPDGWIRHEDPEKRAIFPTLIKREVPPEKVTSTKWITTDDCKPSPSPSAHPEEDDEECEDEEHEHDWDYSLRYDATSSGKLAQATSSPAPEGAPYSHQPGPSDAPHVGAGTVPDDFVIDQPEKRKAWW